MTKEEKELLMKDLCARIPYGVKASTKIGTNIIVSFAGEDTIIGDDGDSYDISFITPYLYPLSSMTKEQKKEFAKLLVYTSSIESIQITGESTYDWLNRNMFDWRGLIPKGLAKDLTHLNIY